jgi:hypothetical protein
MKVPNVFALTVIIALANPVPSTARYSGLSGATEQRTTLTIRSDGSSDARSETTKARAAAEQEIRMWERYEKRASLETVEELGLKPDDTAEPKPLTDEELAARIREMFERRAEQMGELVETRIESMEVTEETVRIVTTRSFAALEEVLAGHWVWSQAGVGFDNVRFEDVAGQLRVTFAPAKDWLRYAKAARQQWKLSGVKSEFRLVLPGKVLSSGFPRSEGNATWFTIDAKDSDTLDAAAKLYEEPAVITAELGGLKLDGPLNSKTLQRLARSGGRSDLDLPILDAGPGFIAEPSSVTISTIYYFPDGEKHYRAARMYGSDRTGMVVRAKLFAPRGRTIQSASGVRVLKAVDDKGRAITSPADEEGEEEWMDSYRSSSRQGSTTPVQIQLPLPEPDAQFIDELSAEAIVVTVGGWKEMTIADLQADAEQELDLSEVLPGAKLVITKVDAKDRRVSIHAQLKGPKAISQLDVKLSGRDDTSSHVSERRFSSGKDGSVRTIAVESYGFPGREPASKSISLLVRFPEDVKRERVQFKLTALDLL